MESDPGQSHSFKSEFSSNQARLKLPHDGAPGPALDSNSLHDTFGKGSEPSSVSQQQSNGDGKEQPVLASPAAQQQPVEVEDSWQGLPLQKDSDTDTADANVLPTIPKDLQPDFSDYIKNSVHVVTTSSTAAPVLGFKVSCFLVKFL